MRVRKAGMNDLDSMKCLADANRDTIGFVRRAALTEAILKEWVLIAEISGTAVGFVNFRHRRDLQTTIYEICVSQQHRRQGIGRLLIDALVQDAIRHRHLYIQLKCPVDNLANQFYCSLGFSLLAEVSGRKRRLNVWRLDV